MYSTENVRKSLQPAVAVAIYVGVFWKGLFVLFYFYICCLGWGRSHTSNKAPLHIFLLWGAAVVLPHRVQTTQSLLTHSSDDLMNGK